VGKNRSPGHQVTRSPVKEKRVLDVFQKTNALLKGHFKLSSGLHSEGYLQCALVLQHPEYAKQLCQELAGRFKTKRPTVVVAPAIGGIVVSYEVAKSLGCRSVFAERENGLMTLRRGFVLEKLDRALVVEDVVTTGGSTREVIDVVRRCGAKVIGVGSIVDRSCEKMDFGVKFSSLIKLDIMTFNPGDCPLCKKEIPIVKPGSKRA
jgi:orotate phosphoribosyltransferase